MTTSSTKGKVSAPAESGETVEKRTPIKSLREGDCSVSIWHRVFVVKAKPTDFYSLTFERTYRDKAGQWKYTRSFGPDDLRKIVTLCQQAEMTIASLQAEED